MKYLSIVAVLAVQLLSVAAQNDSEPPYQCYADFVGSKKLAKRQDSGYGCAVYGTVDASVAPGLRRTHRGKTQQECANLCMCNSKIENTFGCKLFSWRPDNRPDAPESNPDRGRCNLYYGTAREIGFSEIPPSDPMAMNGRVFYDRFCFTSSSVLSGGIPVKSLRTPKSIRDQLTSRTTSHRKYFSTPSVITPAPYTGPTARTEATMTAAPTSATPVLRHKRDTLEDVVEFALAGQ